MKLSLAWIFDHIKYNLKDIKVSEFISKFSAVTAEVEDVQHIKIDISSLFLSRIIKIEKETVTVQCYELNKKISMKLRNNIEVGQLYLIKKDKKTFAWASLSDLGSDAQGLLNEIFVHSDSESGEWKKKFEVEDYIITIDNKAITNRPDMWSHRGFAREMAALLNADLVPEDNFLASKTIRHYANKAPVLGNNPFTLAIDFSSDSCGVPCKRIAGLFLPKVENRASSLYMATRLVRVDSRPLDCLIDCTNYVMFDIGQPMHAFDADKIKSHSLVARCAKKGESIQLLDDQIIQLNDSDFVITDGKDPIALAGIMGGATASVSPQTHSLYIESGSFDATTIRRTANRIKKRTESSARFEKSLDPNQNTQALLRYIKLLSDHSIKFESAETVTSIGSLETEKIINVHHDLIASKIGRVISAQEVNHILTKLGFGFQAFNEKESVVYAITVPTYRATKDVTMAEDIIEEIARFSGYSNVVSQLPVRAMAPFDISSLMKLRQLKQYLAFGMSMHEVQTYAFYDEEFLKKINYDPADSLRIANPLSEHWQRLITSLVPNLLKTVLINSASESSLRFFEFNRVWFYDTIATESKELAGIFYQRKKQLDFYDCKTELNSIFDMLKISVEYKKPTNPLDPWYNKNQSAEIWHDTRIIGQCGKLNSVYSKYFDDCDAFIFELDGGFLTNYKASVNSFKHLAKFPEVDLDISLLVPSNIAVSHLEQLISKSHKLITKVKLVDFYESKEWGSNRSVTFTFVLYDDTKTLTKEEIDGVWNSVVSQMKKIGATVR